MRPLLKDSSSNSNKKNNKRLKNWLSRRKRKPLQIFAVIVPPRNCANITQGLLRATKRLLSANSLPKVAVVAKQTRRLRMPKPRKKKRRTRKISITMRFTLTKSCAASSGWEESTRILTMSRHQSGDLALKSRSLGNSWSKSVKSKPSITCFR